MKAFNGLFSKLLAVTLAAALLSGCGGKEERKAKYLERGKSYLAEKNYDKARIEFKNVLQIDPKDAVGYQYLGQVEEKQRNWAQAFGAYKKASELDPELIEPRVRLAQFYLAQAGALKAQGEKDAAANALGLVQAQIKEIRARDPENADALTLEATLWVNDGDKDKAVPQLEEVVGREPGLQSAATLLAGLYDQQGRKDDAEAVLLSAIKAGTESVALQQRLAVHYINNKQNDKAEAVLRQIVAQNPDELSFRVGLASFMSQTKHADEAEQVLNEAIAADPEDVQRYLLLADFLASSRSKAAAIGKLQQFIKQHPDMTELRLALVRLYMSDNQKDEAKQALRALIDGQGTELAGLRARVVLAQIIASEDINDKRVPVLLKEVLDENPRDNDALLLQWKIAANNKDYVDAINDFRSVLKDQPNNADVLEMLAVAHMAKYEKDLALDTLRRGVESNPKSVKLHISLAQLLAQNGDTDGAMQQLDAVLKTDKHNSPALQAKYELLARKGDAAGMDEVVKLMQEGAPDAEDGYIREARLRFAQKNYPAAIEVLDKVLAKNPGSVAALMAKSDVYTAQKHYKKAIAVVEQLQRAIPDSAEGYFRHGRLLLMQGEPVAAQKQYETALEKSPDSVEVLTALTDLEVKQGQADHARQRLESILKANPAHKSANDLLGLVHMAQKDYPKAEVAFEQQIKVNPKSATVYVQLAQARIANDNLAGAAQAFESGLKQLPDDNRLLIGLAGIREKQQDYEAAIATYEKILEKQPDNAVSTNNLAALLADNSTDQASLDRAAELSVKLEKTTQPAFRDTAGWVYYRKGDYSKAVEILKQVVEKAPKVPVFQYHLGMAYAKQGNKAAAKEHLTLATEGDYSYPGVEEARATLKSL